MGTKKFTILLFLVGVIIGLAHPGNAHGTIETALAFALPFGLAGGVVGLIIDKLTASKK